MVHIARVLVSQLNLDQRNYRLGETPNQRATIKAMIEDQKQGRKLVNHARDIVKVGLSTGEFVWVTPDTTNAGMFIVLEANRRIASVKILETPSLADGTSDEKDFLELSKQYRERAPIRELDVVVYADRSEAKPWIRRRHMPTSSGVGLQPWKPVAKGRAMRDEGESAPRFLAVLELLDDETAAWQEIESALDERWTTVDRVLNSSKLPKILGISIHPRTGKIDFENGDVEGGKDLLRRILTVMASTDFDFGSIERKGDREEFIQRFETWSVKKRDGQRQPPSGGLGEPGKTEPAPAAPGPTRHGRARKDSVERDTLAPKSGSRILQVEGPRLNPFYRECRNIRVEGNENAAALLLRVFIELSSEAILVAKRVPLPSKYQKEGKHNWDEIGIPLSAKIICVADCLDPSKKNKDFQQARLAAQATTRSYYSVHTLHGYFHNRKLIPAASDLKRAWDAWEAYLHAIHSTLSP
jgi:hypothetical protein